MTRRRGLGLKVVEPALGLRYGIRGLESRTPKTPGTVLGDLFERMRNVGGYFCMCEWNRYIDDPTFLAHTDALFNEYGPQLWSDSDDECTIPAWQDRSNGFYKYSRDHAHLRKWFRFWVAEKVESVRTMRALAERRKSAPTSRQGTVDALVGIVDADESSGCELQDEPRHEGSSHGSRETSSPNHHRRGGASLRRHWAKPSSALRAPRKSAPSVPEVRQNASRSPPESTPASEHTGSSYRACGSSLPCTAAPEGSESSHSSEEDRDLSESDDTIVVSSGSDFSNAAIGTAHHGDDESKDDDDDDDDEDPIPPPKRRRTRVSQIESLQSASKISGTTSEAPLGSSLGQSSGEHSILGTHDDFEYLSEEHQTNKLPPRETESVIAEPDAAPASSDASPAHEYQGSNSDIEGEKREPRSSGTPGPNEAAPAGIAKGCKLNDSRPPGLDARPSAAAQNHDIATLWHFQADLQNIYDGICVPKESSPSRGAPVPPEPEGSLTPKAVSERLTAVYARLEQQYPIVAKSVPERASHEQKHMDLVTSSNRADTRRQDLDTKVAALKRREQSLKSELHALQKNLESDEEALIASIEEGQRLRSELSESTRKKGHYERQEQEIKDTQREERELYELMGRVRASQLWSQDAAK